MTEQFNLTHGAHELLSTLSYRNFDTDTATVLDHLGDVSARLLAFVEFYALYGWWILQGSPDPLAGLEGPTSKGEGREGGRSGKGVREEKEGKGRGGEGKMPPRMNSWLRLCVKLWYCVSSNYICRRNSFTPEQPHNSSVLRTGSSLTGA